MVLTKDETVEIEALKQKNRLEIMKLQDGYAKAEHDRKMEELKLKLQTVKEIGKAGLKPEMEAG